MENLKVGLQLYSVRQALSEDMDGALARVKEIGYDYVEFSGGRYGRTAAETRSLLDKHGLTCISVHQSPSFFENDPRDAVEYVKTLGAQLCVIPVVRLPAYIENWEKTIALFRTMAEAFAAEGISLLYHNHDHEVQPLPGDTVPLLQRILEAVPGLSPELDTCWLSYGGADPVTYIQKYADKLSVVHLKDYACDALPPKPMWQLLQEGYPKPQKRSEVAFRYAPVSMGVENWQRILDAVYTTKTDYVIVEQDESREQDPMEAAALSRKYLKNAFSL